VGSVVGNGREGRPDGARVVGTSPLGPTADGGVRVRHFGEGSGVDEGREYSGTY
jgi:hypothetical protein